MNRLLVLILIIQLCSCSSNTNKGAPDQYQDEFMIEIMTDLYIAEAALKNVTEDKADSLRSLYRSQIEKIHDVDLEKFESDLKLIQLMPERYIELHKAVEDTLAFRSKR